MRTMNIYKLDDFLGEKVFIRTVTFHLVGKVKNRIENFFELENASWVANSGMFSNALKEGFGKYAEIEPVGQCFVNIETIVDMFLWNHDLPKEQQ